MSPVVSMKMKLEKSTVFMRDRVTVLAPHSRSAWPFATASKRVCVVTGTYFTASFAILSCFSSEATTWRHRSTEKPVTLLLASTKLKGAASVRCAIVMVLVSAIFFRRPSRACAPAAEHRQRGANEETGAEHGNSWWMHGKDSSTR